jgi:hypothetical protein
VAVVGTRNATPYGLEMARRVSKELTEAGLVVVSGLARGIDTAAHRGALESGKTVAVVGSGLTKIYPEENRDLAKKIAESGAVLSPITLVMFYYGDLSPYLIRIMAAFGAILLLVVALFFFEIVSHDAMRPFATQVMKEYQYDRLQPHNHHQKASVTAIAIGGGNRRWLAKKRIYSWRVATRSLHRLCLPCFC